MEKKDRQYTKCILANMCMVEDKNGNVLVQERTKKDWPGLTFPGGHVEKGETLDEAMKREKTLSSKEVYKGKILDVFLDDVELPSGRIGSFTE